MSLGLQPCSLLNPGYSGVQPVQQFLFAQTGSLLPVRGTGQITFTRGSSATYFNSVGTLQTAATDVARFDYDSSTLAARGLLIEEARTNLALRSADFGTTWSLFNSTVLTDQRTAPDGTIAADKLQEDNATAVHYTSQNVTITAGATYTVSLFAKQGEDRYLQIGFDSGSANGGYATFDLQAGTVTQSANKGTGSGIAASIQAINNSWYRLIVTTVVDAASTAGRMFVVLSNSGTPGFAPSYLGTTGNGIYVWGAQIEAGAFATSYVPTVAATVTRSADVASMTGTNFSSWYNQSQGTFVASYLFDHTIPSAQFPTVLSANDGTTNNQISIYAFVSSGANRSSFICGVAGVTQSDLGSASATFNGSVGTAHKLAGAYAANNFAASFNGSATLTDTSGSLPAPDRLTIGVIGTQYLNGWISSLSYYPVKNGDTLLQRESL